MLGTWVQVVTPLSETAPAGLPAPWAEIVSVLVGKLKGGGRVGMVLEPVMVKRGVIRLAVQALARQLRPKVCSIEASREKWFRLVLSVTPRGPWLVTTIVTTLAAAVLPSSKVMTMALLPACHMEEEVIAFTTLPTKASPRAIKKLCCTDDVGPESTHHGGAPCMSSHSSGIM